MSPIYEYRCKNNHITERIFLSIENSDKEIKCSQCKEKAHKIISAGIFRGEDSWRK